MAYSLEEEDNMLSLFESIANQPIEQQRPYNEVRNPKPMMESAIFEGTKVDFSSWTTDSKKVGKAKTASNPDLSKGSKAAKGTTVATKGTKDQVTENDVVTMKKEDKQVTKLVTEDASHEDKGEPKAKSGSFDSAAKSTASAQRSKAESNKKFSEESKRQRKIDMFRDFVKSLGVDEKSKADAEKVLKKFDSISKYIGKAKTESADGMSGKPMYEGFGDLINSAKKGIKHMTGGVKGYATPGDPNSKSSVEEVATTIINDCSAAVWTLYYMFEYMSKLTAKDIDDDNMGTRKLPKTAAENLEGIKKIAPNGKTYAEICELLRHGKPDKVKAYVDNLHENVVGYAKRLKEMLALATDIHASDMANDIDLWVQGKKCKLFNSENDSTMQKIYDAVRRHLKPTKEGNEDYTYQHPEEACTIFTEINDFVKEMATVEEL